MTKILNINEKISIQTVIALTKNGDEVVIEDNGEPLVKVIPMKRLNEQKVRVAGLGKGTTWMSDDFDK